MAVAQTHALAIGGVAIAALAGGFGIARATGGDETKPPPARSESKDLAAVDDAGTIRIAAIGSVPPIPAPKSARRRQRPDRSTPEPDNPEPSSPAAPTPGATIAPPSGTPAQPAPAPPAPERTPVVGGGTGGEEP